MNRILSVVFTFVLFASAGVFKGRLDKAFEALTIYNYFEAKHQFERSLKKHPSAAHYGLSVIYSRNDNPFYQLDSARVYIVKAFGYYGDHDDKQLQKIAEYGVTDSTLKAQAHYIDSCAFVRAVQRNSVGAFNHFINFFGNDSLAREAAEFRNALAFEQIKIANTHDAYQAFIRTYPEARQVPEARALYEETFYKSKTENGSLASFLAFAESYPNSPYSRTAQDEVYRLSTPNESVSELHRFVKSFPDNPNVEHAWRQIYKKRVRSITPKTLAQFTIDFPDYPFGDELEQIFSLTVTNFYPVEINGKWGFVSERGQVSIPAIFDWVELFHEGLAMASKDGKVGFIDKQGQAAVPFRYDAAELFINGLAVVERGGLYGAVDRSGKVQVPFEYEELGDFVGELTFATKEEKVGYVNQKGKEVIDFKYDFGTTFKNGFAKVAIDNMYGVVNTTGEEVIPLVHEYLDEFDNGMSRAKKDEKYGIYNTRGEVVVPFEYDNVGRLSEGRIAVIKSNRLGFVNDTGKVVIDLKFNVDSRNLRDVAFRHGVVSVFQNGKYGLIDTTGAKVLPSMFDAIGGAEGKLIAVKKNRHWGYVNRANKLIIDYGYDYAADFIGHLSVVKKKERYGVIDTAGVAVVKPLYRLLDLIDSAHYAAMNDSLWGLLHVRGDTLLPFSFQRIEASDDGIVRTQTEKGFGYFSYKLNKWIWRPD